MTVKDLKPGQTGKVVSVVADDAIKRRILDMGVTPGVEVTMIKSAPLGDPIEISIRGYDLSLRKSEAERIEIQ